ncbi:MAG: glycosyltransferase [Thiothrix sp.]|nr:MAG: glycosyltransferase [Thiothrix sp.]
MKKKNPTISLLGVKIGTSPLSELISKAMDTIENKNQAVVFACANPHSLVVANTDKYFREALNQSDHVVADGIGLVLGGKLNGLRIKPRITGADYFLALMNEANSLGGKRVFFLGSTDQVLAKIKARANKDYPHIAAIGTLSPPFGVWSTEEQAHVIDTINHFQPDILWVGMTAPKQETWVHTNRNKLNAAVIGSIGAVFDFYAETQPRAPQWMHKNGLEWLYRMIKEPRRMWRRNFISSPHFLALLLKERYSKRSFTH